MKATSGLWMKREMRVYVIVVVVPAQRCGRNRRSRNCTMLRSDRRSSLGCARWECTSRPWCPVSSATIRRKPANSNPVSKVFRREINYCESYIPHRKAWGLWGLSLYYEPCCWRGRGRRGCWRGRQRRSSCHRRATPRGCLGHARWSRTRRAPALRRAPHLSYLTRPSPPWQRFGSPAWRQTTSAHSSGNLLFKLNWPSFSNSNSITT